MQPVQTGSLTDRSLDAPELLRAYGYGGQRFVCIRGGSGEVVPGTIVFTQGARLCVMTPIANEKNLPNDYSDYSSPFTVLNDTLYVQNFLSVGDGFHQLSALAVDSTGTVIFIAEKGMNATVHAYYFSNANVLQQVASKNRSSVRFVRKAHQEHAALVEVAALALNRSNTRLAVLAGPPSCAMRVYEVSITSKGSVNPLKLGVDIVETLSEASSSEHSVEGEKISKDSSLSTFPILLNKTASEAPLQDEDLHVAIRIIASVDQYTYATSSVSFSPFTDDLIVSSGCGRVVFWSLCVRNSDRLATVVPIEGKIYTDGFGVRVNCHQFTPNGAVICGVTIVVGAPENQIVPLSDEADNGDTTQTNPYGASVCIPTTSPDISSKTSNSANDFFNSRFSGLVRFTNFLQPIGTAILRPDNSIVENQVKEDVLGAQKQSPLELNSVISMCLTKTHIFTIDANGLINICSALSNSFDVIVSYPTCTPFTAHIDFDYALGSLVLSSTLGIMKRVEFCKAGYVSDERQDRNQIFATDPSDAQDSLNNPYMQIVSPQEIKNLDLSTRVINCGFGNSPLIGVCSIGCSQDTRNSEMQSFPESFFRHAEHSATRLCVLNALGILFLIDYKYNTIVGMCYVGPNPLSIRSLGELNAVVVTSATGHVRVIGIQINEGKDVEGDIPQGGAVVSGFVDFKLVFKGRFVFPDPEDKVKDTFTGAQEGGSSELQRPSAVRNQSMLGAQQRTSFLRDPVSASRSLQPGNALGILPAAQRQPLRAHEIHSVAVSEDGSYFVASTKDKLFFFKVDTSALAAALQKHEGNKPKASTVPEKSKQLNLIRRRSTRNSRASIVQFPSGGAFDNCVTYLAQSYTYLSTDITCIALLPRINDTQAASDTDSPVLSRSTQEKKFCMLTTTNGDVQLLRIPESAELLSSGGGEDAGEDIQVAYEDTENSREHCIEFSDLYVNGWRLEIPALRIAPLAQFNTVITLACSSLDKDERIYVLDRAQNPERKDRFVRAVNPVFIIRDHAKTGSAIFLTPPSANGLRYLITGSHDGRITVRDASPYLKRLSPQAKIREKQEPLLEGFAHVSLLGGVSDACCCCYTTTIESSETDEGVEGSGLSRVAMRIATVGYDGFLGIWDVDLALFHSSYSMSSTSDSLQPHYLSAKTLRIAEAHNLLEKEMRKPQDMLLQAKSELVQEDDIRASAEQAAIEAEETLPYPSVTLDTECMYKGACKLREGVVTFLFNNLKNVNVDSAQSGSDDENRSSSTSCINNAEGEFSEKPITSTLHCLKQCSSSSAGLFSLPRTASLFIENVRALSPDQVAAVAFFQIAFHAADEQLLYSSKINKVKMLRSRRAGKEFRERVIARILKLRSELVTIREENEKASEDEKVDLRHFLVESQKASFDASVESAIIKMRSNLELENIRRDYLADLIKKQCWAVMKVKLTPVKAFLNQDLEVFNFHMRVTNPNFAEINKKLKFLRLVEMRDRERRQVKELQDIYVKDASAESTEEELPPDALLLMSKDGLEAFKSNKTASPISPAAGSPSGTAEAAPEEEGTDATTGADTAHNEETEPLDATEQLAATSTKAHNTVDPALFLYDPLLVFTQHRIIFQERLLQLREMALKEGFNVRFNSIVERKKADMHRIKENDAECVKILKELGEERPRFDVQMHPEEFPEKLIFEVDESKVPADKNTDPDEKARLAQAEIDKQKWLERHGADDNSENALKAWMNGRLEKDVKVLRVEVELPEFADETSQKFVPAEDRSEDQARLFSAYEEELKKRTEEVALRRQELEDSFEKLQKESKQIAVNFDGAVGDLLQRRLMTQQAIFNVSLQRVKLVQRAVLFKQRIAVLNAVFSRRRALAISLRAASNQLEAARDHVTAIEKKVTQAQQCVDSVEKEAKCSETFTAEEYGDMLVVYNSKRNRAVAKRKATTAAATESATDDTGVAKGNGDLREALTAWKGAFAQDPFHYLDIVKQNRAEEDAAETRALIAVSVGATAANVGMRNPQEFDIANVDVSRLRPKDLERIPDDLWQNFIEYRVSLIKAERNLELLNREKRSAETEANADERVRDMLQEALDTAVSQFEMCRKAFIREQYNIDEIFVFKQGQVEVKQAPVVTDYSDAVLIDKKYIEKYNTMICDSSEEKVAAIEKNIEKRKELTQLVWDVDYLLFSCKSLQMQLSHLHTLRVTKQMQEFLNGGSDNWNAEQRAKLIAKIDFLRKTMAGKIDDKRQEIRRIKRLVREKEMENYILLDQVSEAQGIVADRQGIVSLQNTASDEIVVQKRMKELRMTKRLQSVLKCQEEEVKVMKNEVDRLRERTFPSFALHEKHVLRDISRAVDWTKK